MVCNYFWAKIGPKTTDRERSFESEENQKPKRGDAKSNARTVNLLDRGKRFEGKQQRASVSFGSPFRFGRLYASSAFSISDLAAKEFNHLPKSALYCLLVFSLALCSPQRAFNLPGFCVKA
jgi:hypothetical protein